MARPAGAQPRKQGSPRVVANNRDRSILAIVMSAGAGVQAVKMGDVALWSRRRPRRR